MQSTKGLDKIVSILGRLVGRYGVEMASGVDLLGREGGGGGGAEQRRL